jgi:GTPase SAR1 family protein
LFVRFAIITDAGIEAWSYTEQDSHYTLQDPQLISGFMIAIQNFSETIIKSPIQEIKFSDLIIYVKTYRTFGLYLFLKEKIDKKTIEENFSNIAKVTLQLLEHQEKGHFPSSSTFEEKILPILAPLTLNEQKKQLTNGLKPYKKPVIRMALLGLAKAGKTSMINYFFKKASRESLNDIKPTIGVVQHIDFEDFIKENILIMDFGGQEIYRRQYFQEVAYWGKISAIIFVIDLQDPITFLPSLDYLNKIWDLVCEENDSSINLSIFLHKYDPEKRAELNNNIQTVLKQFKDYLNVATFFLTSINDQSSNIALLQTIYFSLPDVMLQKLLNDELLDYFEQVILPQFVTLPIVDNIAEEVNSLLPSIQQGASILGTGYAVLLQKSWLNYLKGDWIAKTKKLTSRSFVLNRKSQSIDLTIQDWTNEGISKELTNVLLTGFLEGLLKTFQLESPEIIQEEGRYTTWEIKF